MSDDTGNDGGRALALVHVPRSVAEFLPPNPSSLITECANFLRVHWDDVGHFYAVFSGEAPSIHGAFAGDEWACTFEVQAIAKENGFAYLGSVGTNQLRKALRFAFKRNSGIPMWKLEQSRRLRLEHKATEAAAPKTDPDVTE